MIKGEIKGTRVIVMVEGTSEELAHDVLRLAKAVYDDIVETELSGPLNAKIFRDEILSHIGYVMEVDKLCK